jgi:3-deoxy-D-manno-octulosonate cytidylyltransferase
VRQVDFEGGKMIKNSLPAFLIRRFSQKFQAGAKFKPVMQLFGALRIFNSGLVRYTDYICATKKAMKKAALIPARYAATRFPGKLMQLLGDKTVIRHTYDNTVATGLFDDVIVATDSAVIYDEITGNGGKAVMSKKPHESGSDRIAEAVAGMDVDIVVNVQGDEPFVKKEPLYKLLSVFEGDGVAAVQVASLMQVLKEEKFIADPNYVKVAVDKNSNALFFSRSVIPYPRNEEAPIVYYEHIGVYAFRKQALMNFTSWPMTPLETAEKIECLRYLENGIPLKMVVVDYMGVEIDTPEDLERAAQYLQ